MWQTIIWLDEWLRRRFNWNILLLFILAVGFPSWSHSLELYRDHFEHKPKDYSFVCISNNFLHEISLIYDELWTSNTDSVATETQMRLIQVSINSKQTYNSISLYTFHVETTNGSKIFIENEIKTGGRHLVIADFGSRIACVHLQVSPDAHSNFHVQKC